MRKTEWKPKAAKEPASAKRWLIVVVALVVLVGGGVGGAAWWRYVYPPEDPQVAKVKALQRQVFQSLETQREPAATECASATAEPPPALTPQQREAAMTELRSEMEKLTDEQRGQVMRSFGNVFRERMQATIKEYRALPEEERTAFLDQQIDEWEERRAQFQRGGAAGGGRSGSANRSGASGGPPREGGSSNEGRDRSPPSAERRLEWRRNMLAETSPEERAEAEMFFSDLNARREERGLEPMGPGARR